MSSHLLAKENLMAKISVAGAVGFVDGIIKDLYLIRKI